MKTLITKELDLFLSELKDQFKTTSVTVLINLTRSPYKRRVRRHPMCPNSVEKGNFVYYQPISVQLVNTKEYEENLLKQKARETAPTFRSEGIAEEEVTREESVASHPQSRLSMLIIENYKDLLNEDNRKIQAFHEVVRNEDEEDEDEDSWYTMRVIQLCTILLHLPYRHKKSEVLADFRIEGEIYESPFNLRVSVLEEKQSRGFIINRLIEVNEKKMRRRVNKSSEEYEQKLRTDEYFMNVFQNLKKEEL